MNITKKKEKWKLGGGLSWYFVHICIFEAFSKFKS